MADFFLHLRDTKKLTVATLKGYRSALAAVLRPSGVDLSTSLEISSLFKALSREVPQTRSSTPKWDLALVLDHLNSAIYEPLETVSLQALTRKTVFLLALASAKRVSEIHGLMASVSHPEDWSSISLSFAPDFLAKTELPGSDMHGRSLTIPALSQLATEPDDLRLCPVRALRVYLERTASSRPADSRLFVPLRVVRPSVSRNTISLWIKTTIRLAYAAAGQDQFQLHRRAAHEVRALATSWAFSHCLSVREVMAAASWRAHSTFSSFYLRDVSLIRDGMLHLGPVVAAQRLVQPPTSA